MIKVQKSGKNKWITLEILKRSCASHYSNYQITVPIYFETDFASIPRPLLSIFGKHGRFDEAAVIHDYLYRKKQCICNNLLRPIKRKEADIIFYKLMLADGVRKRKAKCFYYGVRLGGFVSWKR